MVSRSRHGPRVVGKDDTCNVITRDVRVSSANVGTMQGIRMRMGQMIIVQFGRWGRPIMVWKSSGRFYYSPLSLLSLLPFIPSDRQKSPSSIACLHTRALCVVFRAEMWSA